MFLWSKNIVDNQLRVMSMFILRLVDRIHIFRYMSENCWKHFCVVKGYYLSNYENRIGIRKTTTQLVAL
jgi:hypothetical protein